ncbi:Bug family tripartite tricarboxylate transporter substrate binding protein [Xylophilus sp.]|uniref:Bug family tripartite tricarboxylate transporter substrate binding protein n=1 Tax=Xylophilus sp. TaxID=2653893 RepID=UPI0013BD52A0|nr:tripartite tricarboxylate transporter substrate binding protein [Xylophilus sp.]KAF1044225.1 MAG: hypothetical protein GAK38_03654 [Xylophilus sp.]
MRARIRTGGFIMMLGLALPMLAHPAPAPAPAGYPDRPIQVIVPYAAGGTTDLAGRIVAKALGEALNQAVVVENKPGAAGSVGVAQVLRSPPDGYAAAVSGVSSTMLHQLLGRKLPYDPQKDINAVAYLGSSGMVVVTAKDSPYRTLRQVIDQARARPGSISFGSAGNASPGHMATEYLANMAGVRMTHVPYPGDSALMGDLMTGRIDIATVGIASVFSQMKAGSVSTLAITSRERIKSFPNVPTVAEAGLPGYEADIWNLLVLPRGTPAAVDARLNAAINKAMLDKGVQDSLLGIGFTGHPMSLSDIQSFIQSERGKWSKVIRDAKITID